MTNLTHIPLIVIAGPTGVGKTDLSIKLAQAFNGEIINGDSLQVYRHLDIGTGKIKPEEKQGIPHHLIDVLDIHESFNASDFKALAKEKIVQIYKRGHVPIIVGGTGLYLEGLLYDLEFGQKDSTDPGVRQELEVRAENIGNQALWEDLHQKDPAAAKQIPVQNVRRIVRALEVIEVTGNLFSDQKKHTEKQSTFNECLIILDRPRSELYDRINARVEQMVAEGLEKEAYQLYHLSAGQDWQSIKGIGYKEWWPYFEGQETKEWVIETIQQKSRRYAKRQLTWFRNRMKDTHWFEIDETQDVEDQVVKLIQHHLKKEDKHESEYD